MKNIINLLVLTVLNLSILSAQEYQKYLKNSYTEIDSLMALAHKGGDFQQAILLMQAGQAKAKTEFGTMDSVYAEYTGNIAFFYKKTGQYTEAEALYLEAMKIQTKIFEQGHSSIGTTYNNLGALYEKMNYADQALDYYLKAKELWQVQYGEESSQYATVLSNIASLYSGLGEKEKALVLYKETQAIRAKVYGEEHHFYAYTLNNIASVYIAMNKNEEALKLFLQATEILKAIVGEKHPYYASCLNNIAYVQRSMGDYEQALNYYKKSLKVFQASKVHDNMSVGTSLANIASTYYYQKDYQQALKYYEEAKAVKAAVVGTKHPEYAYALNLLALSHHKLGNYDQAWELVNQALQVLTESDLKTELTSSWAEKIQQIDFRTNKHLEYGLNSLEMIYNLIPDDPEIRAVEEKQIIVANLASSLLDQFQNSLQHDNDKLRMLGQNSLWMKRNLNLLSEEENIARAFQLVDQNKSVLLMKASQSRQAYSLGNLPKELVEKDKDLRKQQAKLQAELIAASKEEKDSLRKGLIQVNQEMDAWLKNIEEAHPRYHKLKFQTTKVELAEIQKRLPSNTAMIEYAISDSSLHIFWITAEDQKWLRKNILATELKAKIKSMHEVLSNYSLLSKEHGKASFEQYTDLAYYFYEQLLADLLDGPQEIENLIIITDGELGHLPFESFLTEKAAANSNFKALKYLVLDYNISYHYSANLWTNKLKSNKLNNGEVLAIAADYGEQDNGADLANRDRSAIMLREALQPLPEAKKEVESLSKYLKGVFNWGEHTSERYFKENAGDYAVIHLAMHGLLNDKDPLLSSLAFTEDGDAEENNFLQAYEISKMELNADLVVLSACETGYGRFETGNGIASLARAFMYAGVPSMVVSLWQVNDASTNIVMQRFYQSLAKGESKASALRQAKLDYIEMVEQPLMAHPAFWSPFVLIGNEEPIKLKQTYQLAWLGWPIGGGLLLIFFGRFLLKRRREEV
jgi:CHAT domain-containing protein